MYIIDQTKVQPGDILLTRSNSVISERVRKVSKSEYSHASIIVDHSHCAESDGYGVADLNSMRLWVENKSDLKVLRCKLVSEPLVLKVINFAGSKISTEYSLSEARISNRERSPSSAEEPNRQFCTRFVAKAFAVGGIKIVDNPDYCTPQDILESTHLIIIEDAVKVPNDEERAFALSDDPGIIKAKVLNKMFKSIRDHTRQDIQTSEQLIKYLLQHPELDEEICEIIKNSEALEDWKYNFDNSPELYFHMKFKEKYPDPIYRAAYIRQTSEREKFHLSNLVEHYESMDQEFKKTGLKYYELYKNYYLKLIELSKLRLNVGNPNYSQ